MAFCEQCGEVWDFDGLCGAVQDLLGQLSVSQFEVVLGFVG